MPNKTTYAASGVDIAAGERAVDLIKQRAQETFKNIPYDVVSGIGGFSGVIELPDGRVMGTSTDGVGTKLVLAIILDQHETVGIDLVAMCVNDLAVAGIMPAVFLDYIAQGKQIPERTKEIVDGIIDGCNQSECALLGGEMAEMPGMYRENDYDLAGFALGFADSREKIITGKSIKPGMKVYGFSSSGIHSNGYSLVRQVFDIDLNDYVKTKNILTTYYDELSRTLGEELLEPTFIYVKTIKNLLNNYKIDGLVHITGGGLVENIPRVLPDNCAVKIKKDTMKLPPIFELIKEKGNISSEEMMRTFNCGVGLVVISEEIIEEGMLIGEVVEGEKNVFFS